MWNAINAELRKLVSLPSTFVAAAISVVGTIGVAALNTNSLRGRLDSDSAGSLADVSTIDSGFNAVSFGTIGAIVLGVVAMSSEFSADAGGGRQILTSLACVPRRGRLLAAKAIVLALAVGLLATVTISGTVVVSQAVLGKYGHPLGQVVDELGWRAVGGVAYWICTALIAFAITVVTRSGIVPLIVFIANTSVVSVTYILAKLTSWAKYLPDVAGAQAFATNYPAEHMLTPLAGGVTMGAWTVALLVVSGIVFARRDA
jgi:ABC-2 type transport system permease protein